jgi:High potential iron-sulfur protein
MEFNMKASRRQFVVLAATIASSTMFLHEAWATAVMLAESDPTAQALGYKADATQVDKMKFTKYQPGQACAGCQLYGGKSGEGSGPCPLFGAKEVSAKGWCSSFVKKS